MSLLTLLTLLLFATPLGAGEPPGIYLVDLHSHARSGPHVHDNGSEELGPQAERFHEAGFDAVFHTPHSDLNDGPEPWARQREFLRGREWPLMRLLGEEVTVQRGPRWSVTLGRGNNDHLGVAGLSEMITHALPMRAVCEWAHAQGAVVIVNHPGPGPELWEPGYWDRPGLRDRIDAIEIANGKLMRAFSLDFFAVYTRAVIYRGWGLKVAVIGGTDTHSVRETPQVGTLVVSETPTERGIVDAIRDRRTFVVYRLLDLRLSCPQLGRIIPSGEVSLELTCSRKVKRIRLLREGTAIGNWVGQDRVRFRETITENAAYLWRVDDGRGRAFSSAIWYEPATVPRPDLLVDVEASSFRGRRLDLAVRNAGTASARKVVVEAWSGFPWSAGRLLARRTVPEIAAGSAERLTIRLKKWADRVYIRVDPETSVRESDRDTTDGIEEIDERNNGAILEAKGR